MENINEVTGIILAGGKSSRMGYDKGLATVNGDKLIELVYGSLIKVVDKIIIISNTNSYDYLDVPVYKDMYKDKGPVAGIYTGLYHSTTQKNLVVACDMPFVTPELLTYLLEHVGNNQIVVPSLNSNIEPLCGYYNKNVLEQLKELIEMDVLPVHKVIAFFDHYALPIKEGDSIEQDVFTNINRPEDIQQLFKWEERKRELSSDKASSKKSIQQ